MGLLFSFPPTTPASTLGPERTRLLEAAVTVFATHDYREASLKRIAAAANVTAAMVNYYFEGKQQLYATVIDAAFAKLGELVGGSTQPTLRFEERLRGFIEAHERFTELHPDAAELLVRAAFRGNDGPGAAPERYAPLRTVARELVLTGVHRGECELQAALSPARAADVLLGQVELLVIQRVQRRRNPGAEVPTFTAAEVVSLLLHGITPEVHHGVRIRS